MLFSYYLTYPLYCLVWSVVKLFRRKKKCILYCDDVFDIYLYKNVGKHIKDIEIVAKNKKVKAGLVALGYTKVSTMPSFPDAVIMFRNKAWLFPHPRIIKIGFKHGLYYFKRTSAAKYYNAFDIFFEMSQDGVKRLQQSGVTTATAVGFPKLDTAFDGSLTPEYLKDLAQKIGIDPNKKTLLFSATWDGSGMSAIDKWYDKISTLKDKYNLLATVHTWTSEVYKKALQANPDVHFITDWSLVDYILLSDICISDTSSVIAEFCIFDKPIITFTAPQTARTLPDVMALIKKISIQIDQFADLEKTIETYLNTPQMLHNERQEAIKIFLDIPDGLAGKRAAEKIIELIPDLRK